MGIGTATALRNNKAVVEAKDLRVAGIDYDARYIKAAERRVAQDAKLRDRVSVVCASVYDGQVLAALRPKGGFDAAYFGLIDAHARPRRGVAGRGPPSSGPAGASTSELAGATEGGRAGHAGGQTTSLRYVTTVEIWEAHVVSGRGGAHLP